MVQFEKITLALLLFISSIIPLSVYGQSTAQEFFDAGVEKAGNKDYTGAIADYDSTINMDPIYSDAYYNRAMAELYTDNYKAAIVDFGKTLNFKPNLLKAYANRGMARLEMNDAKGAIKDFDMAIKIDSNEAKVYFMRGEAKLKSKDTNGGCYDMAKAEGLGDERAHKYLKQYCTDVHYAEVADKHYESLKLDWPIDEGWKIASNELDGSIQTITLFRNDETSGDWTERGGMTVNPTLHNVDFEVTMNVIYDQIKTTCPAAKLSLIGKDKKAKYPWVIFKIECDADTASESQMWQIIVGTNDMYINFRAIKKNKISKKLQDKWAAFFKSARVVME